MGTTTERSGPTCKRTTRLSQNKANCKESRLSCTKVNRVDFLYTQKVGKAPESAQDVCGSCGLETVHLGRAFPSGHCWQCRAYGLVPCLTGRVGYIRPLQDISS
uniref:Uncharacterized protein n=1 Tax=Pavo cristatus TaxID=9049 RepID=A0A8C9EGF1_PAVCR